MGYCETVLGFVPVNDNEKFDALIFIFSKLRLKEEFNAKYSSLVGNERVCMEDLCDDDLDLSMFEYELFPDIIMNDVNESGIMLCDLERACFKVDGLATLEIQDDSFFSGLVFCRSDNKNGVDVDFSNLQMIGHDLNDWYEQGRIPKMKLVLEELY